MYKGVWCVGMCNNVLLNVILHCYSTEIEPQQPVHHRKFAQMLFSFIPGLPSQFC